MIAAPELLSLPDFASPSGSFHNERTVRTFPHPDEAIRHRIDNARFMRNECSIMECLETRQRSSALGIEIWSYPSGNAEAEKATRKAAQERIGGGRSIVLVPKPPGDQAQQFGVQHIEPGLGGAEALQSVITDYFSRKIKRYVLGQTLTSESEATGLGSGVARAHQSTFDDVVRYDAQKLAETLTTDLVEPLKAFNFPDANGVNVRFEFEMESESRSADQSVGENGGR
jgi:phage gp29-like protein